MVAEWLRKNGHDVFSVFNESRGMQDADIIQKAFIDDRILVTNDKDFGEKVFRERHPHRGVILLRLEDERSIVKIEIIRRLLENHANNLSGNFVVVTENSVRFARAL